MQENQISSMDFEKQLRLEHGKRIEGSIYNLPKSVIVMSQHIQTPNVFHLIDKHLWLCVCVWGGGGSPASCTQLLGVQCIR